MSYRFVATLWRYPGDAAWYFVTLPHDVADDIEEISAPTRKGFGSVRVEVMLGGSRWRTSLFPDTKTESYVLPVKQAIRRAEGITDGDLVTLEIRLVAD